MRERRRPLLQQPISRRRRIVRLLSAIMPLPVAACFLFADPDALHGDLRSNYHSPSQPSSDLSSEDSGTENLLYQNIGAETLRVSGLSPQCETELDWVDWWYSEWEDCRYLFLPATADRTKLTLTYSGTETMTLSGTPVTSGAETDLLSQADSFSVRVGDTDCGTLKVMQSDLPVVYLTTASGGLDYIDGHKSGTDSGEMLALNADGSISYSGAVEKITSHGNSSWDYSEKKPYNIKLPKKADLYGMGKAKKWVFLGNYLDHAMLRNSVAAEIGRQAGIEYTMDSQYVDLYADGSYRGTYQIYERVQVQKQRVSITDLEKLTKQVNDQPLNEYQQMHGGRGELKGYFADSYRYFDIPNDPEDITGGYLLQFQIYNRYSNPDYSESGFVTTRGQCVQINGPEYASKAQVEYIRQFVQELEDAIYSETGYNDKGRHYSEYVDVDSLLTGYLVQEICENADGQWASFFLWKESDAVGDGKLHYGPAWDFDLAFSNFNRAIEDETGALDEKGEPVKYFSGNAKTLFVVHQCVHGYTSGEEPAAERLGWLGTLYPKEEARIRQLYYENFDWYLQRLCDSTQPGGDLVTQMSQPLSASAALNNARWHMYGGKPYKPLGPVQGENYAECVEYLRKFIENRLTALREIWPAE